MGDLLSGRYSNSGKRPTKETAPTTGDGSTTIPTSPTGPGSAHLGVNLEGLTDYSRLQPFVDMMKSARVWGSAAAPWDETVPTDATGWPTTDAGVVVAVVTRDTSDEGNSYKYLAPGTYALRFTGKATVGAVSSPDVSIANYAYDQAANRSTADVVVGAAATQLILGFRDTIGGVRDVSLRRPGYSDTQTFTNEFIQAAAPFGVFRFMDFLGTNNNPVRTWAERTTPASGTQTGRKGAAYEYAIQMANELGKDIWINIPAGADDDFIRQLATLLKAKLAPERVVYVEYSNELWNFVFSQTKQNMEWAVAEAIAGDTTLTNGKQCTQALFDAASGECNQYWAGFFRVGKRVAETSKIFSGVFGAEAMNTRVRVVFATQFANPAIAEGVLKNIATYRGTPSSLLYGVATAPYFYLPSETASSETATMDQILTGLENSLLTETEPYFAARKAYTTADATGATHKSLADYYGIKSLGYEGGPDLGQSSANGTAKIAANRDARMGGMVKSELTQWFGCGNDLFMYFTLSSQWDRWGYWGLTNDPKNLSGAKYSAARDVAQTARSNLTTCR